MVESSELNAPSGNEARAPKSLIALVLFVSLMDTLGFGIMLPTLPFYARSLGAGPELITFAMAVFTLGLFISTPLWGRASDRFGRKPIILIGLSGSILCYVALAYSESVLVVVGARLVGGLMAGNLSACTAYLVDITSEEERAGVMGLGGAVFGLGFVLGPLLGSVLAGDSFGDSDFAAPALTAAGLSTSALLAVFLLLPESRDADTRREAMAATAIRRERGFAERIRGLGRPILILTLCASLFGVASGFYETILPLWAADFALIDGPDAMWMFFLPTGLALIFVQGALVGPLTARYGEPSMIRVAALFLAIATGAMTLAGNAGNLPAAITVSGVMAAFAGVIMAGTHILASKLAREDERGEVLGLFSSLTTLSRSLGMVASGFLYELLHPHAPYWMASVFFLLTMVVAIRLDGAPAPATASVGTEGPAEV